MIVCLIVSANSFFIALKRSAEDVSDVLYLAEWVKEKTEPDDLIYVDPPQLFAFLTERQTVGASSSSLFIEMADKKYKPDYFVLNAYREQLPFFRAVRFVRNNYDVLEFNLDSRYIIFRRKQ